MDEWRDMETAPKASREEPFLAYRVGGYWSLCYWSERQNAWADYWDGEPAPDYPPTHWMPLPERPPTASSSSPSQTALETTK